ncbi:MAG: GAF domain-containing protein [Alphaproteobacteria bacterium]|nr:GAF domain-containing protein [Alphaproteobacteria bacterium]
MSKLSSTDPLPHFHAVATASAEASSADGFLAALDPALDAVFGHTLFTALLYDAESGYTERYYTSNPDAYPVGGRKPPNLTAWTQNLLVERRPYIGRNADDIREIFFDHELILSLGCESILNIPVVHKGETLGTLNILNEAGWYDESDIPAAMVFAGLAVPAYLELAARYTKER